MRQVSFRLVRRATLRIAVAAALCFASGLAAQTPPPDERSNAAPTFVVSGTVVNLLNGAPLPKTRVSLTDTINRKNSALVFTGDDGQFVFTDVPPGKYFLEGARNGFFPFAYEQHEAFSTAIVTGPWQESRDLILRLTPLAFLSGRVFDEAGEPVRKAMVKLFLDNQQDGRRHTVLISQSTTDDQGFYEITALLPGSYFVAVTAQPWYAVAVGGPVNSRAANSNVPPYLEVGYPITFSNGATDSQAATPIVVGPGDRVQADLHLNPVPLLHFVFRMPTTDAEPQFPAFQKQVFGDSQLLTAGPIAQIGPGLFEMSGVPAGNYTVSYRDSNGQSRSSLLSLRQPGQELDATQGELAGMVKATIKMAGNQPLPSGLSITLLDSHRQAQASQLFSPTGEPADVAPGKYRVVLNAGEGSYSVMRTLVDGVESVGNEISVAPGATTAVTLIVGRGVVNVEGFVKRGDKPASGVMVALIPVEARAHVEMFRRDQSNSDGSFALGAIIPGNYKLIAVEDAWGSQWQQPEVLERYLRHGQSVTIGELMTGTVHLPEAVQIQPR